MLDDLIRRYPFMPTKDEWDKARAALEENTKIRELLNLPPEANLLEVLRTLVHGYENKKTP